MFQNKDYILRIIEQLGRALNRILNQLLGRLDGDLPEVDAELDGIARQVRLDLDREWTRRRLKQMSSSRTP